MSPAQAVSANCPPAFHPSGRAARPDVAVSAVALIACLLAAGCDSRTANYPPLGDVAGLVTEGGRPVANVMVVFQPVAGGRASTGTTDASGRYTLDYTDVARGAMVGEHAVSLAAVVGTTSPKATLGAVEGLEKRFLFTVKAGKNTFDLDLDGK